METQEDLYRKSILEIIDEIVIEVACRYDENFSFSVEVKFKNCMLKVWKARPEGLAKTYSNDEELFNRELWLERHNRSIYVPDNLTKPVRRRLLKHICS